MGYLAGGAANMVWNQPKTGKCFTINKGERVGDMKRNFVPDTEMNNLNFAMMVFDHSSIQYFLTFLPFLPFEMLLYILFHFIF